MVDYILIAAVLVIAYLAIRFWWKNEMQEMQKMMNDPLTKGLIERSRRDNVRRQIAAETDVEKQKQLAKEVYNHKALPLGDVGQVVGVICRGRFVLEKSDGTLNVICGTCAKHLLEQHFSSKKLPPHQNGGATVHGLSAADYASMHFFTIAYSENVMDIEETSGSIKLSHKRVAFRGHIPVCEMSCCAKEV